MSFHTVDFDPANLRLRVSVNGAVISFPRNAVGAELG